MTPAECPQRHLHTTKLSPLAAASGYMLVRCPCGLQYPKFIVRQAN